MENEAPTIASTADRQDVQNRAKITMETNPIATMRASAGKDNPPPSPHFPCLLSNGAVLALLRLSTSSARSQENEEELLYRFSVHERGTHYSRLRLSINGLIRLIISACLYYLGWKRLIFADFNKLFGLPLRDNLHDIWRHRQEWTASSGKTVTARIAHRCDNVFAKGMEKCHEVVGGFKLKWLGVLRMFGMYLCNQLDVLTLCEDAEKKKESSNICNANLKNIDSSNSFEDQVMNMENLTAGLEDECELLVFNFFRIQSEILVLRAIQKYLYTWI